MFRDRIFPSFFTSSKSDSQGNKRMIGVEQETNLQTELRRMCSAEVNVNFYVDTCTLLHPNGVDLIEAVERVFPEYGKELLVPSSVLYELENVGNKDDSKHKISKDMIEKITVLEQLGVVKVVLTNSPKFTDAGLISRFVSECQKNDIILFTQDRELSRKAQGLTSFLDGCVNATHTIKVYKLTAVCSLVENDESHRIERKVINHEYSEIYSEQQLFYPCFHTNA